MAKNLTRRLLAIALALAVFSIATSAVVHLHANASDEARCQVCHIGHAAAPGPSAPVAIEVPVPVARYVAAELASPVLDFFRTASIPRAPPA